MGKNKVGVFFFGLNFFCYRKSIELQQCLNN